MPEIEIVDNTMTIVQLLALYEYSIQETRTNYVLRDRADLVFEGTWTECVDKMIEILGDISVHDVRVFNTRYFWRANA